MSDFYDTTAFAAYNKKVNTELRASMLEQKGDVSAFADLYAALSKSGPLNIDRLMQVCEQRSIQATREQVIAIFKAYDNNFDSNLQVREFAAWWATATDAVSVLLRNALSEAVLEPGTCEQWKRGNSLRVDITAGKVDESFKPKSGIYLTVVPSSEEGLKEIAGTGKVLPFGHAVVRLNVKSSATDEDVQQLIDLVNVAADEIGSSLPGGKPFDLTMKKVTSAAGKRQIEVNVTLMRMPGPPEEEDGGQQDPRVMANAVLNMAGLKNQPLFRGLALGVDFGTDASEVFAPMPPRALAELLDGVRVSGEFEYDDALLRVGTAFMLVSKGIIDNANISKYIAAQFLARGARSLHFTSHFRSYKDVVEQVTAEIAKLPFLAAPAEGESEQDQTLRAMTSELIKGRIEAALGVLAIRSTIIHAAPPMAMLFGEMPEFTPVSVMGPNRTDGQRQIKASIISSLGGKINSGYFNKQAVYIRKRPNRPYVALVENDGIAFAPYTAFVIDCSNEETLAESVRCFTQKCVFISSVDAREKLCFVMCNTRGGISSVDALAKFKASMPLLNQAPEEWWANKVDVFDGNNAPKNLQTFIEENFESSEITDPKDDDDEGKKEGDNNDAEGGMSSGEIKIKIVLGLTKCVAGLAELEVTNELASIGLQIDNLDFGNVMAEVNKEKIRRNRIEFFTRFSQIKKFDEFFEDMERQGLGKYLQKE